jgi:murein DD-endopeptidase MepM/ murein hydrolase activator NlpD
VAPYVPPGPPPTPAPHVVTPPVETGGGMVTVEPGQTLYSVGRETHVPVRALIDANQLEPPYNLRSGQVLTVPRLRQHLVQSDETLYSVARDYDVEASSLARENHLDPPYTIKSGTVLILPPSIETGAAPAALPAPPPPYTPPPPTAGTVAVAPLPPPPSPPATKPAGPPPAVAEAPHTTAAPVAIAPVPAVKPPAPEPAPSAPPPKPSPPPEPESGTKSAPEAQAEAAVAEVVANHPDPVAPVFLWPVRGRVLSVFGTASGGTHNDGINIAAPAGTTVSAADEGVVAYAGNELRGFGNLLLIKHDDGWVTAYAHNEVLLVKKGQRVRRGEPVARVGKTGGVAENQLHFELRHGTTAVDPLDHLPHLTGDTR